MTDFDLMEYIAMLAGVTALLNNMPPLHECDESDLGAMAAATSARTKLYEKVNQLKREQGIEPEEFG